MEWEYLGYWGWSGWSVGVVVCCDDDYFVIFFKDVIVVRVEYDFVVLGGYFDFVWNGIWEVNKCVGKVYFV